MASADPTYNPGGQVVPGEAQIMLQNFWPNVLNETSHLTQNDFKTQDLPLARIKKIMKLDDDVKMISAEAPVLFSKAAEMFISELSLRAWVHTEDNKRRTLQRNDIAMAITKYDQFDFLIDIVPRDELKPTKRPEDNVQKMSLMPDQVQYILQLAQQNQTSTSTPVSQTPAPQQQQIQVPTASQIGLSGNLATVVMQPSDTSQQQQQQQFQMQVQTPTQPQQQQQQQATVPQVFQQVVGPNGDIQSIPIQLTQAQLQAIQLQVQGKQGSQPIIIQTAATQGGQQTDQQQFSTQQVFQLQQGSGSSNGQTVFMQQAGDASQTEDLGS